MREYLPNPEEFQSETARRLYEAMLTGTTRTAGSQAQQNVERSVCSEAPQTVQVPLVKVPVVDKEGYVLLDSIAEVIPLSEPKLDIKKLEES